MQFALVTFRTMSARHECGKRPQHQSLTILAARADAPLRPLERYHRIDQRADRNPQASGVPAGRLLRLSHGPYRPEHRVDSGAQPVRPAVVDFRADRRACDRGLRGTAHRLRREGGERARGGARAEFHHPIAGACLVRSSIRSAAPHRYRAAEPRPRADHVDRRGCRAWCCLPGRSSAAG